MMQDAVLGIALGILTTAWLFMLPGYLFLIGYADVAAAIWAVTMAVAGVWLSAKGMALLKRPDNLSDAALESAYRCRNAGVALGLTGSGLLVFSWQTFLARFISATNPGM